MYNDIYKHVHKRRSYYHGENKNEIPAEEGSGSAADSNGKLFKGIRGIFRKIAEGDIISGTVIDVNEEEVVLDLKYYTQGIIKAAEMSDAPDFSILRDVNKGDVIEAEVIRMDDGAGNILLSRKSANQVLSWEKTERLSGGLHHAEC